MKGGFFHEKNSVGYNNCGYANLDFNVLRWDLCESIRYTLDGSIPNNKSPMLTQLNNELNITKSTTIKVCLFVCVCCALHS